MQIRSATFQLAVCVSLIAVAGLACAKETTRSISVGGVDRKYILSTPAESGGRRPTILILHGGGMSATSGMRTTGMLSLVEREEFVAVYPNALRREWNDGREARQQYRTGDDIAFIRALVKQLISEGIADPKRVYVMGASNGGMMSLRLVCEAADLFAAAAPIIASLPEDIAPGCKPSRAVPILVMNGTADPLVPYNGGGVGFAGRRGRVISTDETIARLRQFNGCAATKKTERLPNAAPDDGSTATVETWADCTSGAPVVLYRIEGGGHRIPHRASTPLPMIDRLLGKENHDFDAAEVIWAFFRDKTL